VRALFGGERYTAELAWADLAAVLPGWEIIACPPDQVSKHLDGVDVICPVGARIDGAVLEAGTFGLVHQFGVGLERVDVARATELGVLVARVPGDAGGNADSVAEIAVLHLLALSRRLDAARAALHEGAGRPGRPAARCRGPRS
jgi:phosphoglycerate dehydrogenase-like enzyme